MLRTYPSRELDDDGWMMMILSEAFSLLPRAELCFFADTRMLLLLYY